MRSVAIVVGLVLLVAAVPLGRHERAHAQTVQLERIDAVYRDVGNVASPALDAYRLEPGWACLVYRSGDIRWGLELCFDPDGRLVETVDRRVSPPLYGSVATDPTAARHTVSRVRLFDLLRSRHVPENDLRDSGY